MVYIPGVIVSVGERVGLRASVEAPTGVAVGVGVSDVGGRFVVKKGSGEEEEVTEGWAGSWGTDSFCPVTR